MTLSHAHPCLEHHVIGFSSLADEQHSRWMDDPAGIAGGCWVVVVHEKIDPPPSTIRPLWNGINRHNSS